MQKSFWKKIHSFDKGIRIVGSLLILFIVFLIVTSFVSTNYFIRISISLVTLLMLIILVKSVVQLFWELTHFSALIRNGESPETELKYEKYDFVRNLKSIHFLFRETIKYLQSIENNTDNFKYIDPKSDLGKTLVDLSLKQNRQISEEKRREWANQGIAKFSDLLRIDKLNLKGFSSKVLSNLIKYIGANQGGFFIKKSEENVNYLELISCFAYDREKHVSKRVNEGQGILGQLMLSNEPVYLTDIPNGYTTISSGLGEATPSSLFVIPLSVDNELYGALELASFEKLDMYKLDFVKKIAENIASALAIISINQNTSQLLIESQNMTEDLKSQEEELRQNMEELQSMGEEMARKQMDLKGLFGVIENNAGLVEFEESGHIIHINKWISDKIGYSINDYKVYQDILWPTESRDSIIERIKSGHKVEKELKLKNRANEVVWLNASYNPIYDQTANFKKGLILCQDITAKKTQELEIRSNLETIDRTLVSLEFNVNGVIKRVNSVFLEVSGYSEEELLRKNYQYLLPKEDIRKRQTILMWQSLKEGNYFNGQFRLKVKSGKTIWLSGTFNPIVDELRRSTKIMLFAQLITQEREKQVELSQTVNALKDSVIIIEMNIDGTIKNPSNKFLELFGYSRMDLRKKHIGEIINVSNNILELLIKGDQAKIHYENVKFRTKQGKEKKYDITVNKVVNSENQVIKFLGIISTPCL